MTIFNSIYQFLVFFKGYIWKIKTTHPLTLESIPLKHPQSLTSPDFTVIFFPKHQKLLKFQLFCLNYKTQYHKTYLLLCSPRKINRYRTQDTPMFKVVQSDRVAMNARLWVNHGTDYFGGWGKYHRVENLKLNQFMKLRP